jgi:ribosomal protein S18 acetylase RimI-like enzyme
MHKCKVTKALPRDKESILTIKRQAHEYFVKNLPHLYCSSDTLYTDNFFNGYFSSPNQVALLAKVDNQTVGYALIDKVTVDLPMMRNRTYVYIQDMAVREDSRNSGVATSLLDAVEKTAREWKAQSLELAVHFNNPAAIRLYKRNGFTIRTYRMEKTLTDQIFYPESLNQEYQRGDRPLH